MKTLFGMALAMTAACMSPVATATSLENGVKVEHLGINNTLVRLKGDARYVMFPVQEDREDARIDVLVDGKLDRTFYVRLAKTRTDYTVPFDLAPYKGHNVVFNIVTGQDRASVREAKNDACWRGFTLTDSIDTSNKEKYRPAYHHTPGHGWMNDPNGMFYKDGEWHLYYQWNPYGSKWQNMTWGHSSSSDLVNWTHHPAAIEPNGLESVFSGSAAIDHENSAGFGEDAVVALYTSAGPSQIQSLAWSDDNGATFHNYPGNPVLTLESEARDPNMFWNPDTRLWTLILAHALDKEMLIFTSPDMKEWTLQSSFGKGLGAQDGVWECPDLFELPVDGNGKSKWILICNLNPGGPFGGSGIQYFIGDFDGKTFTVDRDSEGNVPTKWLDFGKDNYALVSWSDAPSGRRTAIGWMSNWQYAADVPTMQFRSANTLPREIELFSGSDGEVYAASVPSSELLSLRGSLLLDKSSVTVGTTPKQFKLPQENGGLCEILMEVDAAKSREVTLSLCNAKGEKADIIYDTEKNTLKFDRRNSGMVNFSDEFPTVTEAPLFSKGKVALRIFIDRSSVEIFADNGKSVMTNLVFPSEPYSYLSVSTGKGGAKIKNLKIYSLKAASIN